MERSIKENSILITNKGIKDTVNEIKKATEEANNHYNLVIKQN